MTAYPPDHHLLRDLRFSFEHGDAKRSRAWMPIVPEVCTDLGHARAGALATLVDVIGGGLAATAAAPDWIATADLTLHVVRGAPPGSVVEARAEVLRAGRTTVVIEVALVDDREREIGVATMSFSALPRRDINPGVGAIRTAGPSTMATDTSYLALPLFDPIGVEVRDPATGSIDVPVTEWTLNSMGAMQGGVVALVTDIAAETGLRAATGEPLVVVDMQLSYLGFGRVGPVRSHVDVLGTAAGHGTARIELVDTGAENRRMTVARAGASRGLA
jgi:uncharacterized protein (TIGR00369 family)